MDIEKLRVLLSVVESGSVQAAARVLGQPRSQLRRRLDDLESEVGIPLLLRDAAGVRLTAAGVVFVERGRPLLESMNSLLSDVRASASEAVGVLHVVEPIGMPLKLRVQLLLATRIALPRLRIVSHQVADPLACLDGSYDLVLHDGPLPDRKAWFSRVVARAPMRALASPEYLQARGTPRSLADLAGHDVLGWSRAQAPTTCWPLVAGGHVEVSPWYAGRRPQNRLNS